MAYIEGEIVIELPADEVLDLVADERNEPRFNKRMLRVKMTTLGVPRCAQPVVEILFFEGCPNHALARELVRRVSAELDVDPDVRLVNVETPEDAHRLRFLGSPIVRVNGRDVEPGADHRGDFALACRVYQTNGGLQGQPGRGMPT